MVSSRYQLPLRLDCGRDRVHSGRERGAEAVAPGGEHVAAMALDRRADDDVVGLHRRGHVRRRRFPESRRVLDVGEQERHRPDGGCTDTAGLYRWSGRFGGRASGYAPVPGSLRTSSPPLVAAPTSLRPALPDWSTPGRDARRRGPLPARARWVRAGASRDQGPRLVICPSSRPTPAGPLIQLPSSVAIQPDLRRPDKVFGDISPVQRVQPVPIPPAREKIEMLTQVSGNGIPWHNDGATVPTRPPPFHDTNAVRHPAVRPRGRAGEVPGRARQAGWCPGVRTSAT